jgi:transcriptional regulator with XRE-family HTH domain
MNQKKNYKSVSQMVRETSDDPSFTELFEDRLHARRMIGDLTVQRAVHGLSQKDIAEKMGCTQSRISKLETTNDAELRIGDLAAYSDALGLRVRIVLESKNRDALTRVKNHVFQIKHEIDQLAKLPSGDQRIAKGVSGFLYQALFNIVTVLQDSAQKLPPKTDDGSPCVSFEICSDDEEGEQNEPWPPNKPILLTG